MYLKSIKVAGFKSFADQQIIRFDNPFTCIVGPNGCGKSNIIDAVKWVIGESSAKNLRGSSLTDVIFNGSTSRKPLGVAKVELIFDNSDQRLKGQWSAFKEISLSRVLYRDGQSHYYLNQTKCRRKDIIDLFLGTGLGPRSYAIIEQGMVNKFIDAKPMDMRLQVEEASGVSKYKEKRKETLAKLTEAQENLERLTDLKDELEKRVNTLEKQSEKARQYEHLKESWAGARQELYSTLWRSAQEEFSQSSKNLEQKKNELQEQQTSFQNFQARWGRLFIDLEQQEEIVFEAQRETQNLSSELKDTQHQWQKNQERKTYLSEDLKECQDTQQNLLLKIQTLGQSDDNHEKEKELAASCLELKAALDQAERQWQEAQSQHDKLAQDYQNLLKRRQAPQSQADVLNAQIKNLEQQILKNQETLHKSTPVQEELEKELTHWKEKKVSFCLTTLKLQTQNLDQLREEQETTFEQTQEKILELKQSQSYAQSQKKSLEQKVLQAQRQLENADSKPLDFLEQNFKGYQTLFKDIEVDKKIAPALALSMANKDIIQVTQRPSLDQLKQVLPKHVELSWGVKKTFSFCQSAALPSYFEKYEIISNWQQVEERLQNWQEEKGQDKIFVLPNGALLAKNWFQPAAELAQKSRAQLALEYEQWNEELKEKEQELQTISKKIQSFEEQSSQQREQRQKLKTQYQQAQKDLQQAQVFEQKADLKIDYLKKTLEEKKQYYIKLQKDSQENKENILEYRVQLEEVLKLIENQESSLMQSELDLKEKKEQLTQFREERQLAYEAHKSEQTNLQSLERQKDALKVQVEQIYQEKDRYEQKEKTLLVELEKLEPILTTLDQEISSLNQKIELSRQTYQKFEQKLEELKQQNIQVTKTRKSFEKTISQLKDVIHKNEITWEKALVSQNHVKEQILDLGLDFQSLDEIHAEESKETLKKKVHQLEQDIENLGPVNLKACSEYNQESERLQELVLQSEDVHQSLKLLTDAVLDLDKEIVQTYQKTLNALKNSFAELFPKLFGGGQAQLKEVEIEGYEEKGIVVFAQPPGKKNASLSALSGGEKALTAAALVFAFFKLNPAPFCLMDEIDAPLDDTNTARLASMLDYLSESVQCLCVTHSKIMMEKGHALYGVTMREPGVSRLVSVDLNKSLAQIKDPT